MFDLGSKLDVHRLYTAMDTSRQAKRPFERNRVEAIREFVGSHYNDSGAEFKVLVNLLAQTAEVYTIGLAANNPRVMVSAVDRRLFPFAHRYSIALNNYVREMHFAETNQRIVLDAFFTLGIAKVFLAEWRSIQLARDVWADPGRPYISAISFDDYGLDMSVKDVRRCKFMWDEYRVPWEDLQADPDMDRRVLKEISPTSKWDRGEETAAQITSGASIDDDEYGPMVDLMDVWLPEIEKVAVFPRHAETRPLKVVDQGPEGGPYKLLSFLDVPDNVMPLAPAMNLMELHLLYNGLARKLARQARRQKQNPIFRPASQDDASRLQRASDGEWIKVNDPTGVGTLNQGGVDQPGLAFSANVFDLFSRQAGNLEAMAGLGPQASTLGQEQMIAQAVSRKEAAMQVATHKFVKSLMEALGHLVWRDEQLAIPGQEEVAPRTGVFVDRSWTPEHREGDEWQYQFDVEPYSTNFESPESKLSKLERFLDRMVALAPIAQASGQTFDMQRIVQLYAETLRLPEAEEIVTFAQALGPQGSEEGAGMPAETTRNYVRRNVAAGGSPQARSMAMQQTLLGGQGGERQGLVMAVPGGAGV